MKKCTNIIMTIFVIVILKGCIIAPIYLCYAPAWTAYQWGGLRYLTKTIRFEFSCVWHTLRDDWQTGCNCLIFNLA